MTVYVDVETFARIAEGTQKHLIIKAGTEGIKGGSGDTGMRLRIRAQLDEGCLSSLELHTRAPYKIVDPLFPGHWIAVWLSVWSQVQKTAWCDECEHFDRACAGGAGADNLMADQKACKLKHRTLFLLPESESDHDWGFRRFDKCDCPDYIPRGSSPPPPMPEREL